MTPERLYDYLKQFLTEDRMSLFESVLDQRTRHLTVVLEDIFQPHNASAVLRSCDCFGVQDIHITEANNDYEVNKNVAMGASKWLTLHRHGQDNMAIDRCFHDLKSSGYSIVATTPHSNGVSLHELDISKPVALVFGTELNGLSEKAIQQADQYITIPMYGFTESYNISVSAALCLYDLKHRLMASDQKWNLSENEKAELRVEWAMKSIRSSDLIVERYLAENE
ncbi:MAG: RNA methyltransferase [Flavobacteriales bacterium]|nr:RNA methyltransferase [Flavobacteriales bacterium]